MFFQRRLWKRNVMLKGTIIIEGLFLNQVLVTHCPRPQGYLCQLLTSLFSLNTGRREPLLTQVSSVCYVLGTVPELRLQL